MPRADFRTCSASGSLSFLFVQIQPRGGGLEGRSRPDRPVDVFRPDGISCTSQEGDNVRFRLNADRIEVAKRKVGITYVNPLKEATVSHLELEVHQRDGEQDLHDILPAEMFTQLLPAETVM